MQLNHCRLSQKRSWDSNMKYNEFKKGDKVRIINKKEIEKTWPSNSKRIQFGEVETVDADELGGKILLSNNRYAINFKHEWLELVTDSESKNLPDMNSIEIGDIYTVKDPRICAMFDSESNAKYIRITSKAATFLSYDILDNKLKRIAYCFGHEMQDNLDQKVEEPQKEESKYEPKVGDKVKIIKCCTKNNPFHHEGKVGTFNRMAGQEYSIQIEGSTQNCDAVEVKPLETEMSVPSTEFELKVGQKVWIIKEPTGLHIGEIVEVDNIVSVAAFRCRCHPKTCFSRNAVINDIFELVEDVKEEIPVDDMAEIDDIFPWDGPVTPKDLLVNIPSFQEILNKMGKLVVVSTPKGSSLFSDSGMVSADANFYEWDKPNTKKGGVLNKMKFLLKKYIDKDIKVLVKAGDLDSDLNRTSQGGTLLSDFLFDKFKTELADIRRAELREDKEDDKESKK